MVSEGEHRAVWAETGPEAFTGAAEFCGDARHEAYLISRGVRPMALLGACTETPEAIERARGLLLSEGQQHEGAIPFMIARGDGWVEYGFASDAWIVELYGWVLRGAPEERRDALTGLLLGYSSSSIARHLAAARARQGKGVLL